MGSPSKTPSQASGIAANKPARPATAGANDTLKGPGADLPHLLKRSNTPGQTETISNSNAYVGEATAGPSSPPRPALGRLTTLPDQRILDSPETRNRPRHQWSIPKSAKGSRAATLFLGRDYERWSMHDRDSLGVGLKLGWQRRTGSSSDLPALSSEYVSGEEDDESYDSDAITDESGGSSIAPSGRSSRRSSRSSRSRSGSGSWKRPGVLGSVSALHPLSSMADESLQQQGYRRSSVANTSGERASGDGSVSPSSSVRSIASRRRRFSSNGPEAAFLRHETVIGIHVPRRDSMSSSASFGGRQLPAGVERMSLAPLSPLVTPKPPSGRPSKIDVASHSKAAEQEEAAARTQNYQGAAPEHPAVGKAKTLHRALSSSDMLRQAAAAAAASADPSSESDQDFHDDERHFSSHSTSPLGRTPSPRPAALQLARRRKPIAVEGTLYDRTGPFREGAVTDGLSVRLFSAEHASNHSGYEEVEREENFSSSGSKVPSSRHGKSHSRQHKREGGRSNGTSHTGAETVSVRSRSDTLEEGPDDDDDIDPTVPQVKDATTATTYLITTPDNRVSSAAKLRRWAMDGDGNFYAAMEIKSVEAKIRSAVDPNDSKGAAYTRSLAKILRQTYLDDILNEVQKAETLNPGRNSVAKLLVTSDGKYLRLEEDFPEETFFVIAGCEEEELYPVVALVFCQTLRHIHRFHAAGWMHGDIKLENLMFDSQGSLVVIDYENANPFRIPGGDGCVSLMSFDWVPPEAAPSTDGRRAGPGADLWALGSNLVRAFALRDGVDDGRIREMMLESGQGTFLRYRDSLVTVDESSQRASMADVDLTPIFESVRLHEEGLQAQAHHGRDASSSSSGGNRSNNRASPRGQRDTNGNGSNRGGDDVDVVTPARLLHSFAIAAPHLLRYVLACCLTRDPAVRSVEAELEGLRLASEIEAEHGGATMRVAKRAVDVAIQLSGSEWVRPKLDDARRSLGLGAEAGDQEGGDGASYGDGGIQDAAAAAATCAVED